MHKQKIFLAVFLGLSFVLASCSGLNLRRGYAGVSSDSHAKGKAPLHIESEEVLPYTAKLTYGEICVNSKRYGKEVCFPCYSRGQGGCEAALEDLVDKAIACSSPVGPAQGRYPAYGTALPRASAPVPTPIPGPVASGYNVPLNTYPYFSR